MLFLLGLCFFFLPFSRASQQRDASSTLLFPDTTTESLDKVKITLPSGFEGQVNLLLISFEPEQSNQIESWMPEAQALQHMNFQFRYYKMPVSNQENMIFRWWDNSSLRSVETDPETWHWIVPLYVNKQQFRQSLEIQGEKQAVAVLVDKGGQVLWKASGSITDDKKTALIAAVAAATLH
nr:hypothetical protein [Acidobacterium sp. S8]